MVTNERYGYNNNINNNNFVGGTYNNKNFNTLEPGRYNNFAGQSSNNMQDFLPRNEI